jgi:hypothetical protein
MVLEKKRLSAADIEAQTALELPDRQTLNSCGSLFVVNVFNDNEYYLFSFNNINEANNFCFFINSTFVNNGYQCNIFQQSPIGLPSLW